MSESKAHRVEIREVDGETLRKLVDYIYTAEIEVTEDNVQVGRRGEAFITRDDSDFGHERRPFRVTLRQEIRM